MVPPTSAATSSIFPGQRFARLHWRSVVVEVAGQEVDLVGNDGLERFTQVDVEMAGVVSFYLTARGSSGVGQGFCCRRHRVFIGNAEEDRQADAFHRPTRPVGRDGGRHPSSYLIDERGSGRDERQRTG